MVEKVREPLTKFLFDSLKSKREIDESFIAEVIEIVVNALGLNEYVRGYKINNEPWDGSNEIDAAFYRYDSKKIIIELQACIEFGMYVSQRLRLDTFKKIAIVYNIIIQTLLHELEHANQCKKVDKKGNDLESMIITYSSLNMLLTLRDGYFDKLVDEGYSESLIYLYLQEKNKRYHKYYQYAPIERLAEYYSHKTMAMILKELGNLSVIYYFECLKLYQNYIKGYIEGITPTKFYFRMLGISEFWPKIEEASKALDFESRVSLGLPINEEEYEYLKDPTYMLERIVLK